MILVWSQSPKNSISNYNLMMQTKRLNSNLKLFTHWLRSILNGMINKFGCFNILPSKVLRKEIMYYLLIHMKNLLFTLVLRHYWVKWECFLIEFYYLEMLNLMGLFQLSVASVWPDEKWPSYYISSTIICCFLIRMLHFY